MTRPTRSSMLLVSYRRVNKTTDYSSIVLGCDEIVIVIQCDASDSWLGAALLQNGLPVAYSSRALTSAETIYAQIEKELLAIVFDCEKFDQYVYGRDKVHVQIDHKPREVIFMRPLVTAPKRLQRMLLRFQRYRLEVMYVSGSEMSSHTLSRAYISGNPSVRAVTSAEIDMTEGLSVSPRRLQELPYATTRVTVFYRNSYRLPLEGGLRKHHTLTLMCAHTITCVTN